MTNKEYLNIILSLFEKNKKSDMLNLCKKFGNILDTVLMAYMFYKYNFLPYCATTHLSNSDITEYLNTYNPISSNPSSENVIVSEECCMFMDSVINFMSSKIIKENSQGKQDINCEYMTYLFLTNKSLKAYNLFQACLSTRDYEYAVSTLKNKLCKVYKLPTNEDLLKYGKFLTTPFSNTLGNCFGREKELSELVDILSRKKKNNAILIGQPGVGKTAIVEGFAKLLMSDKCPKQFEGYHVYEASISSMLAGAKYRGDFEERMEVVLNTIAEHGSNIILFIDEIHNIMVNHSEAGSSSPGMSAGDILKPYMSRPGLLLIGATTEQEYRMLEKDSALGRRFSAIHVKEPNDVAVYNLLENSLSDYQQHFNLIIPKNIISEIIKYAKDYIPNRYMPDKALDLLDESCVYCLNHTDRRELTCEDVAHATEALTGIQIPITGEQSYNKINSIVSHMEYTIVGQKQAIDYMSATVKKYFLGLTSPKKPIGSFLFVGPTGVGKTQLCKELAYSMFTRESFIRVDMSEYMEKHSVSKLIGAPPGYVGFGSGGVLTNAVKNNPYSVVLFDEIEKAHPDVFNILLQVLDDGRITDSEGDIVNFTNCIVVLTSNIGASDVMEKSKNCIGFGNSGLTDTDRVKIYEANVKKKFPPEFINRLDKVVYFNTLTEEDIQKLVDRELCTIVNKFKSTNVIVKISSPVKASLLDKCYSSEYGARYVHRIVSSEIEDMLVNYLIDNELLTLQEPITITVKKQNNVFITV